MHELETLVGLRDEINAAMDVQVSRAYDAGYSYGDLARVLGTSRQAAHRRFRHLAGRSPRADTQPVTATEPAVDVLRLARDEAIRSDAASLGSEHVLIGALRSASREVRSLLGRGVGVDAARAAAGDSDRPADPVGPAASKRRFLHAATLVAGRREVGVSALLLAALDDPDDGAKRILNALGVSHTSLRTELRAAAATGYTRHPR